MPDPLTPNDPYGDSVGFGPSSSAEVAARTAPPRPDLLAAIALSLPAFSPGLAALLLLLRRPRAQVSPQVPGPEPEGKR